MFGAALDAISAWASELGGVGLFILALLDSSFLSFPQVNDVLIIVLATQQPGLMPYYAAMTTVGSLLGCLFLYAAARRGGERFLRRRFAGSKVTRGLAFYQRHGVLAVLVPAILPAPTPFKLFVLLAGTSRMPVWRFCVAVVIGRSIRYFAQGYLAVRYGERAVEIVRDNAVAVGIAAASVALAIGIGYTLWKRYRARHPGSTA